MTRYANQTTVTIEKSRAEIEATLRRYGATAFAGGWDTTRAMIEFQAFDRRVRFVLQMPSITDQSITHYRHGRSGFLRARSPEAIRTAHEQACRQRWRALALAIKAKLEAVESNISTFEGEFLAHIVMPDGRTVCEHVTPVIAESYASGAVKQLLLGSG